MKRMLDGTWTLEKEGLPIADARIPGGVYESLLGAGLIEDPFWRDNDETAYKICEQDYAFSRTFQADEALISQDEVWLVCEGLDTLAVILLNGTIVGKAENMHRTYKFPIKDYLRLGENHLCIRFSSPVDYVRKMDMKRPVWGASHTMPGYQHIRKAHCMFGWDWGPVLPNMGIWRSIAIQGYRIAALEDVRFRQRHRENRVELSAEIAVRRFRGGQLTAEMEICHPDGRISRIEKDFAAEACVLEALIENPQLWWPNGYGGQPLYRVKVAIRDKEILDEKEYEIGLRTVELSTGRDQWGREFAFVVNGMKIFAMGANYIPEDCLLGRRTPEKTERLIQDCVRANFNMLRIWGGGHYADDYLLSLCDRYGILVWQDFAFACALYDLNQAFRENIAREVEDNIRRMRHHACLALWCGNNEIETGLVNWDIPANDKLRADYIDLFERMIPEILAQNDDEHSYWPSSPSSFGGFQRPEDINCGDTHYWEVWHGMKPFEDYKNHYFRFCSEFGFQSFPAMKTIESFTLPQDRNIFSYVMERHQKNEAANGKILAYLSQNYRYPKDLRQLVYASQLLQAEAITFGVEHMRRNRGQCMGALYWQLNDCWPVASWSSIDYYGRWKALHYAARRFFAPVLLSCDLRESVGILNVSNERRTPFSGVVRWFLRNNDGSVVREGSVPVEVPPLSARNIAELNLEEETAGKEERMNRYLEYELVEAGRVISRGTSLFVKPKHYHFSDPGITWRVDENETEFVIRLQSRAYARFVELSVPDRDLLFSDNYFDLTAGKELAVTIDKAQLPAAVSAGELEDMLSVNSVFDIA